jgi:pimeloyl-ACP methyl ester carboxylesterase
MPLIRLNVSPEKGALTLHGSAKSPEDLLSGMRACPGPAIIMVHGYKYQPNSPRHCPHQSIFDAKTGWPAELGLGGRDALGICFGWPARGSLARMFATATQTGQNLAKVIGMLHAATPERPIHLIAHSMGAEVVLSALEQAAPGSVSRVVLITGASFQSHATRALHSPAGRKAELFNITTRENDLFDFIFERLLKAPKRNDRALGQGIQSPNAVNIELDCPRTLTALDSLGAAIAAPARLVCHWSGYTRPGTMALYRALLLHPRQMPLRWLADRLPHSLSPRWSRLPLAGQNKRRIMQRSPG